MRYVLSVFALFFSLSSFAAEPAQQNQAVRLSCVARVLNMDGSKAFYEQVPLKKIVDGRYAGPIDDYTLSIDVSNAPFVVLSLQFSTRKGLDVQGVIEPSTGIGPELTYTLEPKASAPKIERYLEVGCGLEGRSVSFKSRQ